MSHKPQISTTEIRRLYEIESLTLRQIAKRVGLTHQAVHLRLVTAGVELRPSWPQVVAIDREELERLYVEERLSIRRIATKYRTSPKTVAEAIAGYGIRKNPEGRSLKHPELARLRVGETVTLPRPTPGAAGPKRIHAYAKSCGIRVSVRSIDGTKVMVARIEDTPTRPRNHRPDIPTDEMRRMYEEGLTLEQIAERVGITRPSVAGRLTRAGVKLKRRGGQRKAFDADLMKRLYLEEELTVAQIATQLGAARRTVANFLKENGVELRGSGSRKSGKYAVIGTLEIGESVTLPRPDWRDRWHEHFHKHAKNSGVRVSVRKVDDATARITRIG